MGNVRKGMEKVKDICLPCEISSSSLKGLATMTFIQLAILLKQTFTETYKELVIVLGIEKDPWVSIKFRVQ